VQIKAARTFGTVDGAYQKLLGTQVRTHCAQLGQKTLNNPFEIKIKKSYGESKLSEKTAHLIIF